MKFISLFALVAIASAQKGGGKGGKGKRQRTMTDEEMLEAATKMLDAPVECMSKKDCKEQEGARRCAGVKDTSAFDTVEVWMCAPGPLCGNTITVEDKDVTIAVTCKTGEGKGAVKLLSGAASLIALAYAM